MNFYYTFLLLLVVLSAYSENPEHGKPPDSFDLTIAAVSHLSVQYPHHRPNSRVDNMPSQTGHPTSAGPPSAMGWPDPISLLMAMGWPELMVG